MRGERLLHWLCLRRTQTAFLEIFFQKSNSSESVRFHFMIFTVSAVGGELGSLV